MVSEWSGLNHGLEFDAVGSGETEGLGLVEEGWAWKEGAGLGRRGLGLEGGGWAWKERAGLGGRGLDLERGAEESQGFSGVLQSATTVQKSK